MIRALLVDDHSLFRRGVRQVLEEGGIVVVGEAGDGEEAVQLTARLSPDIVLMDLHMPKLSGVEATERVSADTRVLILTISDQDQDLFPAIAAGAHGYLLKAAPPEDLLRAVTTVAKGGSVLSPEVTAAVIGAARRPTRGRLPDLSPREKEVLRLVAEGLSNRAIAERLGVTEHTVKTYVERLFEKLEVSSRAGAAAIAGEHGLL
jgi:DNA-binding NarL/FixJ family response regulator